MMRVLVTGASGFIGRQTLAPLLGRGCEVHAVSSRPAPAGNDFPRALHWHSADILDAVQMRALMEQLKPQALLHMAWYVEPGKYLESPRNLDWAAASLELLRAFQQHGGKRVVLAGTCFEYGPSEAPLHELRSALAPATLYATCKHGLRLMMERFAANTGLSAAWGRIFYLYGRHEAPQRLVPAVIGAHLRGEAPRITAGERVLDFMHVADVGAAFAALLSSDVRGAVNIATGQGVAIHELAKQIAAEMGREMPPANLGTPNSPPPSKSEPAHIVADVSRLRDEVGFRPAYSLQAGLRDAINFWREQSTQAAAAAPREQS